MKATGFLAREKAGPPENPKEVRDVLARYITPERRVAIIGMPQVKAVAAGVKRAAASPGGK